MLELARPGDREVINVLAMQVHAMHADWRPDIFSETSELYPFTRMQELIQNRSLYVARMDDVVVGYLQIQIRQIAFPGLVQRKVMVIEEFAVHESCRGQGIGTKMMTDLRTLAKAFGCSDLQLNVYPQNDDAIGFYQKCGLMIQSITMQCKL